jgi:hypothetical protein
MAQLPGLDRINGMDQHDNIQEQAVPDPDE